MKKGFVSQEDIDQEVLIKEDYWESKGQPHKIHIIFDPNELKTGLI